MEATRMDHCEVKVFKTPGGSDVDAWSAECTLGIRASTVRVYARGETRDKAREALARELHEFEIEMANVRSELK
jgi:hypothetical protein